MLLSYDKVATGASTTSTSCRPLQRKSGARFHLGPVRRKHPSRKRARDSGNSALIHRHRVMPHVVIVRSVDLPVFLIDASAIERAGAVHARSEPDQLREIPAVQRG